MASIHPPIPEGVADIGGMSTADPGDESLIILESLLCLMREKNLLSRADMEMLCEKVDRRARGVSQNPRECCAVAANEASGLMRRLTNYIGQRYGGKHARF